MDNLLVSRILGRWSLICRSLCHLARYQLYRGTRTAQTHYNTAQFISGGGTCISSGLLRNPSSSYASQRYMSTTTRDSANAYGIRERVSFSHLNFHHEVLQHLQLFGISDMKPQQYIMAKCIMDAVDIQEASVRKASASKYIFYNSGNSGRTTGYILPLLQLYSANNADRSPIGSTIIVTKDEASSREIGCLIVAMSPKIGCLVLEDVMDDVDLTKKRDSSARQDTHDAVSRFLNKQLATRELSGQHGGVPNILVVSTHKLKIILDHKRISPSCLQDIACVIFDDFTHYIAKGEILVNLYNRIRAAKRVATTAETLKANDGTSVGNTSTTHSKSPLQGVAQAGLPGDTHMIVIVDSIGDAFCKFAAEHLGGYWLYDFKNGNKQRLVGEGVTDSVRIEVDLGQEPDIVNVSLDERNTNMPIEHSICKVVGSKSKWERIYTLKCLVHHYLNLPTIAVDPFLAPMIKVPKASYQCIIFVSNRAQQRHLLSLECFRDVATHLGRGLTALERAQNLSNFRNGVKPILIATDASVAGCNFDDVRYVFNYHPPSSFESYRMRAGIAGKRSNSLCITLYSKKEYPTFSKLLKDIGKRVSIHVPPTKEYMLQNKLKWLERFAGDLVAANPSYMAPIIDKAKELLANDDDGKIIKKCLALLIGDDVPSSGGYDGKAASVFDCSLLTGKQGYTAVTVFDGHSGDGMSIGDFKKLVQRLLQDHNVEKVLGKYCRTETGYVVDVSTAELKKLFEAAEGEPNICLEVTKQLPKMILDMGHPSQKAKGHMNRLPWRSYKIRRLELQKRMLRSPT